MDVKVIVIEIKVIISTLTLMCLEKQEGKKKYMYSLFRENISLPRSSRNNRNPQGESGRRFRYINTRTVGKKAVRKK